MASPTMPPFPVTPLRDLRGSDVGVLPTAGLPGEPPILGPEGEYYGHEWSQRRYDTLDARVDGWLRDATRAVEILDLGAATGARAADFARAGHRVTAVDCVDGRAAIAGRNATLRAGAARCPPITFVQADLRDPTGLPAGHPFDLIHLRRVLNFITLEQFDVCLAAILPSLAGPGWLVASFIATGLGDAAGMIDSTPPGGPGGWQVYPGFHAHPFGAVLDLVRRHDLVVVEAFSDGAVEAGLIACRRSPRP